MLKKISITLFIITFTSLIFGQTQEENYIKTTTYKIAATASQEDNVSSLNKIDQINYIDGLGRLKQSILAGGGGQGENILYHIQYDDYGRTPFQYLPVASLVLEGTDPLSLIPKAELQSSISNFYNTPKYEYTLNPYSQNSYETSPLNRVLERGAPGNSWRVITGLDTDHTIKYEYKSNTLYDILNFKVNFQGGNLESPILELSGTFLSKQLYVRIVKDENWTPSSGNNHTTREFTNKQGQVLLKRTYEDNIAHNTYYIYDDFGNLTYVLSPEASSSITYGFPKQLVANAQDILNDLGYQYKYDYRNRLIEKKIPGKGREYIVYNLLDQPILTQDARLRESGQWLLTKYDAFGRVAFTGIVSSEQDRTWQQNNANDTQNYPTVYETQRTTHNTVAGTQMYYSNSSFPTTSVSEILTVNYYDDYVDLGGYTIPSSVYGQNITTQTKSLPTVSKVRVLGTDDWITSVTGYDNKGRAIFGHSENSYLDTEDITESQLDFTGKVLESTTTHRKGNHQEIVTIDYYSYDHQNRLTLHSQRIDSEPVQLIASNTYDNLGQLTSKRVGGQLFESGYTDIHANINVSEEAIISKVGGSNGYNAGLSTIGKIDGDGGISFRTIHNNKRYVVGLNLTDSGDSYTDLDYMFAFNQTDGRYRILIRETGSNNYITGYHNYEPNDSFAIEREDNILSFIHNGNTITSYTMTQDYDMLVGDISMRDVGASIVDLNLYATTIDRSLQKINYEYNVRGWLTDINRLGGSRRGPLFSFHINYDNPVVGDAGLAGRAVPLYNGNISQTIWKTRSEDRERRTYGYKYDDLNRISTAYSRKGTHLTEYDHFNVSGIEYDKNGNIETLTRQGENSDGNALSMDNLVYTYNGNQLRKVSDNGHPNLKNEGFYDGNTSGNDYDYDINGNMIRDRNKGIDGITYNHLNLPITVAIDGTDSQNQLQLGSINYVYDATGIKLAKIVRDNIQQSTISTFYSGGYIYEDNNGNEQLKIFPHPEGYIEPVYHQTRSIARFNTATRTSSFSGYQYVFQYRDHLGNIRLTYSDSDGDGAINPNTEILEETNFYPFGLEHRGYNNTIIGTENNLQTFQGQELEEDLGKNTIAYQWRDYDPAIGRFNKIDRFAAKYLDNSPYQFSTNNPVYFREINGDTIKVNHGNRSLTYNDGNYYENGNLVERNKRGKITGKGRSFFNSIEGKLSKIGSKSRGSSLLNILDTSENVVNIEYKEGASASLPSTDGFGKPFNLQNDASFYERQASGETSAGDGIGAGSTIFFDHNISHGINTTNGRVTNEDNTFVLAHELFHSAEGNFGMLSFKPTAKGLIREYRATHFTNLLRKDFNLGYKRINGNSGVSSDSYYTGGSPLLQTPGYINNLNNDINNVLLKQ